MSASSKKKLRNAEAAEKLTERQLAEQKEAKKLKLYSTIFVVAVVAMLVFALTVGVFQFIAGSGIRERNSVALTVGTEEINAIDMSYFYVDTIQEFCNSNSYYLAMLLDTSKPLNEQVFNENTEETWADYFLRSAQTSAHSVYTLSLAAEAEGYTLPADQLQSLESNISMLDFYAQMNGFTNGDSYLKAIYGPAASVETYREYNYRMVLASSYSSNHALSLSYDDAALREAESDNYDDYSSYTFHSYTLSASRFLEGGTQNEDGTTTYTDEEKAAAIAAAEEAAKTLTAEEITSVEALDLAIARLPINSGTGAKSTENKSVLSTQISDKAISQWLSENRKEGDLTYIAQETGTVNGDTTISGYTVLFFIDKNENKYALPNVRHILIGSQSVINGESSYTEEELATYKAEAERILSEWEQGDKTEESFAALASTYSMDGGSSTNGGLYENIIPSQMVAPFDEWCFANHNIGDTGIVETDFGFHIMYFSGLSDMTYRDLLINDELASAEMQEWSQTLIEAYPMVVGDTKYLPMDYVIGGMQ